jgi:hypothetical protein
MVYGLMRRDALQATGGVAPTWGPDRLLLAQLSMRGTFVRVPRALYSRRLNRPHDESPAAAQAQIDRVVGVSNPAERVLYERPSRRIAREHHLRAVRSEFTGIDRVLAEVTTRTAFHYRYDVRDPIAFLIHPGLRTRQRLYRWVRRQMP